MKVEDRKKTEWRQKERGAGGAALAAPVASLLLLH